MSDAGSMFGAVVSAVLAAMLFLLVMRDKKTALQSGSDAKNDYVKAKSDPAGKMTVEKESPSQELTLRLKAMRERRELALAQSQAVLPHTAAPPPVPAEKAVEKEIPSQELTLRLKAMRERRELALAQSQAVLPHTAAPPPVPVEKAVEKESPFPKVQWIPHGTSVEIYNLRLPQGMIYFGSSETEEWKTPRPFIDPQKPIGPSSSYWGNQKVGYWPSYSRIAPECRLTYLYWLMGRRSDPEIDIGYVFLFFYGLERRILFDKAMDDVDEIVAEVRRLQQIYGKNDSFLGYSTRFLDAIDLLRDSLCIDTPLFPSTSLDNAIPLPVLIGLGRQIDAGTPLNADWMLNWLIHTPKTQLKIYISGSYVIFRSLFRAYFNQKFEGGITIARPKTTIGSLPYDTASRDFQVEIRGKFSDLPSVTRLTKPLELVQEIVEQCTIELEAYRAFIGRYPNAIGTVRAKLLLPAIILEQSAEEILSLQEWLHHSSLVPLGTLLEKLAVNLKDQKFGKADARMLADFLECLDLGIEPDVRFGAKTPKREDYMALFALPTDLNGSLQPPSPAYHHAALVVDLLSLIIHADGVVTEEEKSGVRNWARAQNHLPLVELVRLQAHVEQVLATPLSLPSVKAKLSAIALDKRHDLARLLIVLTATNAQIGVAEMKRLEHIYRHLGLERTLLFSDIHALEGRGDDPVTVRKASPSLGGRAIPPPPSEQGQVPSSPPIILDMAQIAKIRDDTAQVSSLLADIFVEESDVIPPPANLGTPPAAQDGPFGTLEAPYQALLTQLMARSDWPRDAFDALCRSLDMMPNGALETLNEWAFETFDDAILEDGDPIIMNLSLLENAA